MALINAGANVNSFIDYSKQTALHLASMFNPGIVCALLEAGAWVNILDTNGESPLFLAAWKNHKETVSALLAYGADPHLGRSPLLHSLISSEMKSFLREVVQTRDFTGFSFGPQLP